MFNILDTSGIPKQQHYKVYHITIQKSQILEASWKPKREYQERLIFPIKNHEQFWKHLGSLLITEQVNITIKKFRKFLEV